MSSPQPGDSYDVKKRATALHRKRKLKRRLSSLGAIACSLAAIGGASVLFSPPSNVAPAIGDNAQSLANGKKLYDTSCLSCHGANLEGVQGRGPTLLGVGEASAYFQVSSGRMPAARNENQPLRKAPKFDEQQIEDLAGYVEARGGGPTVYRTPNGKIADEKDLTTGDPGAGSELFRLNCASCHNYTGRGGALSSGKFAPPLDAPTAQQIYDAMLTGPQSMPVFSDKQLTPKEKKDIITFIKLATESAPQGGYDLGGFGPVSEGMAMWVIGIGLIVGFAMWIGSRA